MLVAGENKSYTKIYENDGVKLYEVTYSFSSNSPGGDVKKVFYALYRKDNDCTLEITGPDKDKILKISSLITNTTQYKTLEEQFYGITVLDERIIDTSNITINKISSINDYLDLGIKVEESIIDVHFLSPKDKTYLPGLKIIENWKLVTEEDGYKIYHGYSDGIQSDALKIIKDDKEYYIDLTIPVDLYKNEREINSDGSTTSYMYLTQETIKELIQEILKILK